VINVQSYWQSLVIGVIILLGVTFDTYRRSSSVRQLLRRGPARGAASKLPAASRNRVEPGNSA